MMLSLRFVPFGLLGLYSCIVTVSRPYFVEVKLTVFADGLSRAMAIGVADSSLALPQRQRRSLNTGSRCALENRMTDMIS